MKIRNGFVSNSSSSSFVVIGSGPENYSSLIADVLDGEIVLGRNGDSEFGWGPETITDVFSRINFAYLQAKHKDEWHEMLEDVIKKSVGCTSIVWEVDGYIDHQSSASEGENTEIFESKDVLSRFLFCGDSLIELDHDNH